MQFNKLAAIAGSALMAGLAIAAPVLATSVTSLNKVDSLVSVSGNTVSFPLFVVGADAATADVAGAVNIAVKFASDATTTQQVTTSTTAAAISGGVSMATATNPLVLWNNFASSKQVLTGTDLPDILVSGTYVDSGSVSVPYSQYLTFNNSVYNGQMVYDTPSGATAPSLGLKFTGNWQIYNYLLSFTKQISETAASGVVTNLVNTQLNIMGRTWTITTATSATDSLSLTMLSGKNSQTVTTEAPGTFAVGDKSYTVTLVAVGTINNVAAVTIQVTGGGLAGTETLQILTGGTKTLSDGTLVGVTSIFSTTKTGAIDSATIFLGADKLELQDANVTDGTYYTGIKVNGVSVTDAQVRMTGTAATTGTVTLNSIEVKWSPSLEQFVKPGQSLTDPVFGGFKIYFGGLNPDITDTTNRETITVTPSGTTASIQFTTSGGYLLSQNFIRSTNPVAGNVSLTDAGGYPLHVLEGETVAQNEYAVLGQNSLAGSAQNPFGHIIRVLSLQTAASGTSQFQDVASGSTLQVTGGNTTMYLDGQAYKVCILSTNATKFTWGTGATNDCSVSSTGANIDVFPTIQTSKGAWVSITKPQNITGLTNSTIYTLNLPTGSVAIQLGHNGTTAAPAVTLGTAQYNISSVNDSTGAIYVRASNNAGSVFTTPGVLITEGLDESQVRNVIAFRLDSDATYNRVDIPPAPSFTSAGITQTPTVSGTTQNKYMDQYGSYVVYDSTMPGTFSLSFPVSQAQAALGVGANPTSSTGGVGGTITTQKVLPVLTDVVKLDTEVTASDKTNYDMVLLGGPAVNRLTWELMVSSDKQASYPYPVYGGQFAAAGVSMTANTGLIKLVTDGFTTGKTVLIIAGWEAVNTDMAARVVQDGTKLASITGTTATVTGTTFDTVTVS